MKLIYLEWTDATTRNDGWHTKEEVEDYVNNNEQYIIRESGFLFKETSKHIILISRVVAAYQDWEEQYGTIHRIPKSWIRKRVNLTKYI